MSDVLSDVERAQAITEVKVLQAEFRAVRQRAEELEARIQHLIRQIDLSRPADNKSELEFE